MKPQPSLIPRFNYNYNCRDFAYGIKSIFSNNHDVKILSSIFGTNQFFFTNNGRSSLYVILRALNLQKGSRVGVPLYSCTVVFDAITKARYIPCFIDIDLSNYTLDLHDLKNKIGDLDALIVIHTFGRPAEMDEIKKVADAIPIIEDCAHSLFSEYKGKKTGTLGDASFFSLGKYISAGDGGMIILNNDDEKLKQNIQNEISLLPTTSNLTEVRGSIFAYLYSFLYHKPWFGLFAYQIGRCVDKRINISGNKGFDATTIKNYSLGVFLNKLKTFKGKIELQRINSKMMINELQYSSLILPYEREETWCNYYLFPILFESKEKRDEAWKLLRNMDIDTAKLYAMTPSLAKQYYGYKNDCPNTEKFSNIVLTIPNYYSLSNENLLKITVALKNGVV